VREENRKFIARNDHYLEEEKVKIMFDIEKTKEKEILSLE